MWEQRRLALFTQHAGEITTDEIVSVGTGLLSHVTFQYLELRMVVKGRIVSVNH